MTSNELEVAPSVYAASSRIIINDKGECSFHHNGAELTMTKDELRFFVTMGQRIINDDVGPMPCTCGENQGCTSCHLVRA